MELRPGYKQTEAGVFPLEWKVKRLGEVAKIHDGTHQTPKYVPDGVPFYSVEHITSGDFTRTKFISEEEHRFLTRSHKIERGDILMTRIGSIGDCRLVDWDVYASFYVSLALLKIHGADAAFISQYSNSRAFKTEVELHSLPSATPKKINLGPISDIRLPIPSLTEQRAIAAALNDVDALVDGLERLIAKKRDLKQAAMQQLLTGQTRLPGFSGEWEVKRLDQVADVIDPHPSHRAPNEVSSGVPFVGIGDLDENGNIVGSKLRYVDRSILIEHSARYDLSEELIGLGRVASIGKVVCLKPLPEGYAISPTLGIIRGRIVKRGYLLYALRSKFITDQFIRIMSGSTRSSVGMEVLRKLNVLLPPSPEEQTAIATILTDMDTELAVLESRRDKTRSLKQAMMQELLTGRTRLI